MAAPHTPPPGSASASGPGLSATFSTPGLPPDYRDALGLDLHGYVAPSIEEAYHIHALHNGAAIATPATPGQFGILAPIAVSVPVMETPVDGIFSVQNNAHRQEVGRSNGHLSNNVYSHRSTQRYKRKPFISHYWDCRMKGRPPGTPKSDDPNKKKRKRNARQRDLCDVKIKITEHFPGARLGLDNTSGLDVSLAGQRLWTIQRVNGNGGNGKGDGVAGPHKHTLERSDEIKKNSVQRYLANQGGVKKDKEKVQVSHIHDANSEEKEFLIWGILEKAPLKATGAALLTARKHAKENEIKLYAACFCPFSQRIWIALEAKGMPYQYCETDAFRHPTQPLLADPNGCNIIRGDADLMEINRHIVPNFFKLLQYQDPALGDEARVSLQGSIDTLVEAADKKVVDP
ncbi:hypothetical protein FocTR4_00001601 [Fusarium oxysporum f. sp. cubense]|uniref:GST N-terminal domain-containing protein n=1 Tax=Fusarium oxysporum f. sp. cubense TaxID=61366 RepID=A0A5C6SZ47_FUSOC|nr:hypothetical protein FocTR4_00001601 [Fusarium oxysporum f. sp. cubense]